MCNYLRWKKYFLWNNFLMKVVNWWQKWLKFAYINSNDSIINCHRTCSYQYFTGLRLGFLEQLQIALGRQTLEQWFPGSLKVLLVCTVFLSQLVRNLFEFLPLVSYCSHFFFLLIGLNLESRYDFNFNVLISHHRINDAYYLKSDLFHCFKNFSISLIYW